ncbi:B2 protein-like [Asparagus officinalis]|uniref:B2 protein-like n=1 Tax=Asparagus officinalis TaxID=4686 RepID=UPI00098E4A1A|nr:B2 protein-like [Asparagus officinalis]
MDNLWQLGDEFRSHSKVTEDRQWIAMTSKLAELTRTNRDQTNNLDYSRNPVEAKSWERLGFQEDNKFESLNLGLMNLDLRMNEVPVKSSIGNSMYNMNMNNTNNMNNMNMVYQKSNINTFNNFKMNTGMSKYANINSSKDVNNNSNSANNNNNSSNNNNNIADKRFKTLPSTEMLPRNEVLGGYIFVCNNDTMQEDLKRQLFGLPPRYRDSVRAITPGLPLFLYNYTTHQLHGIFEAASFGGSNIDPTAWEDKKCKGESRFPAQVRIRVKKLCKPLEEDAFRPVLHHYDGPKFRLELSIAETLSLLDLCDKEGM